jgi:hypothetical protein
MDVEAPFCGGLIVFHRHGAVTPLPGHVQGQAYAGTFDFLSAHGKGVIEGIPGKFRIPEHRGHHLAQIPGPLHRHRDVKLSLGAHQGDGGVGYAGDNDFMFPGKGFHLRKGGRGWVMNCIHALISF